ncbi:zinc finger, CCHC-type containing protein [Tanacetum coccineum]
MDVVAMKHIASNFVKLDKFEGVNFRRWQKKIHFLLSSMSVVYVLTTPILEDGDDDPTVKQIRKRAKWDNDDYACRGLILICMFDSLFDIYQNVESRKELWDSLEARYMAEDASSKKFLIYTTTKMNMDEAIQVSCIIDKLSLSWKDFKHTLKHKKEELTLVELGSHLHIEESLRMQDSDKPKSNNVVGPYDLCDLHVTPSLGNKKYFVTFIDDASRFCYVYLLHTKDEAKDKFKVFKTEVELQQGYLIKKSRTDRGGLSQGFWGEAMAVVRLPDPKLKTLGERGIECIFVGYVEHSKVFRFYLIEPNDSVSINSIIESKDVIFDENRFSSVHIPSLRVNGTEDIGGSVVPEEVTEEIKEAINDEMDFIIGNNTWVLADLHPCCKPLGCKWIFKRKLKIDGIIKKFKARRFIQSFKQKSRIDYFDTYAPVARISTIKRLIVMASIHNLIIHQMDVKTAFLNGDLDKVVYMNQPQGFIMPGNENKVCKLIKSLYRLKQAPKQWHQKFDEVVLSNGYLLNQADKCVYSKFDETGKGVIIFLYVDNMLIFSTDQAQVDLTTEFLSSRFFMKNMGEADIILVSTPMDTSEKLMPNNSQAVSQLEYSRVIGCLIYAMTCTRPDIAFAVGKLSRYTSNPGTQHWQAIQRASKKQTCITDSTMELEFVALAAAGKEAEWLKNLLLEIPLWSKPIAPISIRCDSAATLAKAYS